MSAGPGHRGRWVVLGLYLGIVGFAGLAGFLVVRFAPVDPRPVELFFLVTVPPTPLGLAVFGAAVVGLALGVPLVLIAGVSRRIDRDDG